MTGVLNAMVAPSVSRYSVTIGNSASIYGYNDSSAFGSISSALFRGETIRNITSGTQVGAEYDIQIVIEGSHAQGLFGVLAVQGTDGTMRSFPSSTASYTTFGSAPVLTQWTWDTNTPAWTATTPSPRTLVIS